LSDCIATIFDSRHILKSPTFSVLNEKNSVREEVINKLKRQFNLAQGYGLTAPQIHEPYALAIVNFQMLGFKELSDCELLIDPVLTSVDGAQKIRESCRSIPYASAKVERYYRCELKYYNEELTEKYVALEGWPAFYIQHAMEHLSGKLFVDNFDPQIKKFFLKKARKKHKSVLEKKERLKREFEEDHLELHGKNKKRKK
jgi:peptide deformylase